MKNFAKGAAFLVFGVLCSPIMFGMLAPLVAHKMTGSVIAVVLATVVTFSAWAAAWSWMKENNWHYHL